MSRRRPRSGIAGPRSAAPGGKSGTEPPHSPNRVPARRCPHRPIGEAAIVRHGIPPLSSPRQSTDYNGTGETAMDSSRANPPAMARELSDVRRRMTNDHGLAEADPVSAISLA